MSELHIVTCRKCQDVIGSGSEDEMATVRAIHERDNPLHGCWMGLLSVLNVGSVAPWVADWMREYSQGE